MKSHTTFTYLCRDVVTKGLCTSGVLLLLIHSSIQLWKRTLGSNFYLVPSLLDTQNSPRARVPGHQHRTTLGGSLKFSITSYGLHLHDVCQGRRKNVVQKRAPFYPLPGLRGLSRVWKDIPPLCGMWMWCIFLIAFLGSRSLLLPPRTPNFSAMQFKWDEAHLQLPGELISVSHSPGHSLGGNMGSRVNKAEF